MPRSIPVLAKAAFLALLAGLLACGGSNPVSPATPAPPPPTTLPPTTTLAELSATVTSPEDGNTIGCRDDVHFKATVTNRGATPVNVTGVKRQGSVLKGDCNPAPDFTYSVLATAAPNATTTITDRPAFSNGSGCCIDAATCNDVCTFKETFQVVTALGDVAAGSFQYQVIFGDCGRCAGASAARQGACRPPSL